MATVDDLVDVLMTMLQRLGNGGEERGRRRIEEKMFKRLETFKESQVEWREWSFQVKVITKGINYEFEDFLEQIETDNNYDQDKIMADMVDADEASIKQAAKEFYNALCVLCAGEALIVARGVTSGDGGEAWHRLKKDITPILWQAL